MKKDQLRVSIDRGGTFTDVYAEFSGCFFQEKLLSNDPDHYDDAALEGLRRICSRVDLNPSPGFSLEPGNFEWIRMGTTLATNAILESKVEPVLLVITHGLKDLLQIGDQSRPNLFDLKIPPLKAFYQDVLEVNERVLPTREGFRILHPPDLERIRSDLSKAYQRGMRALAIVLMHGYEFKDHEILVRDLARSLGFKQISVSHEIMPSIRILERGNITVLDACLSPLIRDYVQGFQLGFKTPFPQKNLLFMQSHGGLCKSDEFKGSNSLLSGPAGGILGYARSFYRKKPLIGFDMGGTSTDVSRFDGKLNLSLNHRLHHLPVKTPQLDILTVAAGGGSRLLYRHGLLQVGPESSGAHPGPLCYRKNGFLSLTDANVFLGRIQPDYFPKIFGPDHLDPLDLEATKTGFFKLTEKINHDLAQEGKKTLTPEEVALGFIEVANESMIKPIREISIARGFDPKDHDLACFGGAGGQHGCAIARNLGISTVHIHRHAGILSAIGLHHANPSRQVYRSAQLELTEATKPKLDAYFRELIRSQSSKEPELSDIEKFLHLRFEGTQTALMIPYVKGQDPGQEFLEQHRKLFGFSLGKLRIQVDEIRVDFTQKTGDVQRPEIKKSTEPPSPMDSRPCYFDQGWLDTPIYALDSLYAKDQIEGPALIISQDSTLLIEPKCHATISALGDLEIRVLTLDKKLNRTHPENPISLSIFQNRFMSLAEQMGRVLQKTATSTNIQERLDFSCALFDRQGNLVSNAPHIPVHLGSMSTCVKKALELYPPGPGSGSLNPGDVLISNLPSQGGTHLPDITLISPFFREGKLLAWVASRGHHADIGGMSPGSMPSAATNLDEEGVQLPMAKIMENGVFSEEKVILSLRNAGARRIEDNLADLKAQIGANQHGLNQLNELMQTLGQTEIVAAMQSIQDISERAVQSFLRGLGKSRLEAQDQMDDGSQLHLEIRIDAKQGSAVFDFSGTARESESNTNAPPAVTTSCLIYCLRCLVQDELPLNEGFLRPIQLKLEPGSLLNPSANKAVAAGNVTTSQRVVDLVFKAFNFCAASQGCMNNLAFGNESFGYYETLGGGAGAGPDYSGASGVHTHMTNTRITDPEILEKRYPVHLKQFSIREHSGGAGKFKGGNGLIREFEFLEKVEVELLTERRKSAPFGMHGGLPGKPGTNWVCRKSETMQGDSESDWKPLPGRYRLDMDCGDRIRIESPGGGGYGKARV